MQQNLSELNCISEKLKEQLLKYFPALKLNNKLHETYW
jgi:hypothetical protein